MFSYHNNLISNLFYFRIKIVRTPSDECLFEPSPSSPNSPGLPLHRPTPWGVGPRSPRSPTSPTSPLSPGDGERILSSRGSSRLSTPLSPIKESRKEMGSLVELPSSPAKELTIKLQDVPRKPSSRIRSVKAGRIFFGGGGEFYASE